MRTSILSRSVIAVASLAIGSVALAAAPATAAPSGITRDMVLSITDSIRTAEADDTGYPDSVYEGVERLVALGCGFTPSEQNGIEGLNFKLVTPGHVDGVVVSAYLHEVTDPETGAYAHRQCSFGALVTTDASFTLSGEATIAAVAQPVDQRRMADPVTPTTAPAPVQTKLSGNVFATPALNLPANGDFAAVTFSATGNATKTTAATTARKIWDKTSKAEKKAAKKKYTKRIATAKKAYKKALQQADGSADKKAAAKRAYSAKRAKIVTRYQHEVWNYRYVKKAGTKTENRPFKVSTRVQAMLFG